MLFKLLCEQYGYVNHEINWNIRMGVGVAIGDDVIPLMWEL